MTKDIATSVTKSFRFGQVTADRLRELSEIFDTTENAVVTLAILRLFQQERKRAAKRYRSTGGMQQEV